MCIYYEPSTVGGPHMVLLKCIIVSYPPRIDTHILAVPTDQ